MSVNKWKATNIYGALKNYNLYTDATNTTKIEDASIHTDGLLTCSQILTGEDVEQKINFFSLTNNSTIAILCHKEVVDKSIGYTIASFEGGDSNINSQSNLYLKISDNEIMHLTNSNVSSIVNINAPSFSVSGVNINAIYQAIGSYQPTINSSSNLTCNSIITGEYIEQKLNFFSLTNNADIAILCHKDVVDKSIGYTIASFNSGECNFNAQNIMYLKISDNIKCYINNAGFHCLDNIDCASISFNGTYINAIYQSISGMSAYQTIAGMPSLTGYETSSHASTIYQTKTDMTNFVSQTQLTTNLTSYLTNSSITNLLDKTDAIALYQSISGMGSYVTTAAASSAYQTILNMSVYLLIADAAATYQSINNMSNYATNTALGSYLTTAIASSTYQTITGMSSYLTTATAASTYKTIASMSSYLTTAIAASTYQTIAGMSSYLTSATAASTYQTKLTGSTDLTVRTFTCQNQTCNNILDVTVKVNTASLNINSTSLISGCQFGYITAGSSATITVGFNGAGFASIPIVTCSILYTGNGTLNLYIVSIATTYFQYNIYAAGAHAETGKTVQWHAFC